MVLHKISRNTKIPGIGSAKSEKKYKNVLLQKQEPTPYDEERIFLKNSMQISGLYIILASAIWWIDGYVRQSMPIAGNLLIAIESSIAGILLLAFLIIFRKKKIQKLQNIKYFIAMVLVGGVAGSWCFAQALAATQSLWFVFVLIGLQPIFTIISSSIVLKEHPRASFYAFAATTIFASILLTIGDTGFSLESSSLRAYIFALLTAIFWGSSTTIGKVVITHNSHLYALALKYFFTGLIGWVIVFFSHEMIGVWAILEKVSLRPLNILFIIFISDILASALYLRSLKNIPATMATIFELAFPLTGFILDFILYDVTPSPMKVVAAFTILICIVILPHCHFIEEDAEIQPIVA